MTYKLTILYYEILINLIIDIYFQRIKKKSIIPVKCLLLYNIYQHMFNYSTYKYVLIQM